MLEGRQQDHREVELRSWGKKHTITPRAEIFESLGINFRKFLSLIACEASYRRQTVLVF